jgi:hypothetical protein
MFGSRKIDLRLSPRAERFVQRFRISAKLLNPILVISRVRFNQEDKERWLISLGERTEIREGWIGITSDFDFVVFQECVFDQLDCKILDIDESGSEVVLVDRLSG